MGCATSCEADRPDAAYAVVVTSEAGPRVPPAVAGVDPASLSEFDMVVAAESIRHPSPRGLRAVEPSPLMLHRQRRRIVRAAVAAGRVNGRLDQFQTVPEPADVIRESCRAVGQWLPDVPLPHGVVAVPPRAPAAGDAEVERCVTPGQTLSHSLSLSVPESFFLPQASQLSVSLSPATSMCDVASPPTLAPQPSAPRDGAEQRPAERVRLPGAYPSECEQAVDDDEPALPDSPGLLGGSLRAEHHRPSHPDAVVSFIAAATPAAAALPRRPYLPPSPMRRAAVEEPPSPSLGSPPILPTADELTSANLSTNNRLLKPRRRVTFELPPGECGWDNRE